MGPSDQTLGENAPSKKYNLVKAPVEAAILVSCKQTFASHYIHKYKSATAAIQLLLSCSHVFIMWLKISILFTRTDLLNM